MGGSLVTCSRTSTLCERASLSRPAVPVAPVADAGSGHRSDKVADGPGGTSIKTPTKLVHSFVPFSTAMTHDFSALKGRVLRKTPPALFTTLTLLATQLASLPPTTENLLQTAQTFLPTLGVKPTLAPREALARIARTQAYEFPASVAVLGGVAGQDALNILGGKEEPVRNWAVLEGERSAVSVWALGL